MQTDLEHDHLHIPPVLHTKQHGNVATERLRSYVERIERLSEEVKGLNGDIKDIYDEAKSSGFDVKALRAVVSLRRKDRAEQDEHLSLVELYRASLDA